MESNFLKFLILIPYFVSCYLHAQRNIKFQTFSFPKNIQESSGLIFTNNHLITHNDSGDESNLYLINLQNLSVKKIVVLNAKNKDWEDITQDEKNIYIGDFGNNYGKRTDLGYYTISKRNIINTDTVQAIFNPFEVEEYNPTSNILHYHNFDFEAFTKYNNQFWYFSKNWNNRNTNIYISSLESPKIPLKKQHTLKVNGLITGSTFSYKYKLFILSGYQDFHPFLIFLDPIKLTFYKIFLNDYIGKGSQIEGIYAHKDNLYLSREKLYFKKKNLEILMPTNLFSFKLSDFIEQYKVLQRLK